MPKRAPPNQTSIKAVAAAAGVSLMTVSRAIRGLDGMSDATRRKVLAAAQALNYVPNSNARALAVANSSILPRLN